MCKSYEPVIYWGRMDVKLLLLKRKRKFINMYYFETGGQRTFVLQIRTDD